MCPLITSLAASHPYTPEKLGGEFWSKTIHKLFSSHKHTKILPKLSHFPCPMDKRIKQLENTHDKQNVWERTICPKLI